MSLKALTTNTAPAEAAHILAEDDAAIFQSIFGEDGVFSTGQKLKATVISNNKVRIADGIVCIGGHIARTVHGDYTDLTIENGVSGKNRNDLIIGRFSTTGEGGVDTMQLAVKKGTAGTTAADPAVTKGDLYSGSKLREVPLWRVKIEGLSIVKVEQLFKIIPTIPQVKAELDELTSKMLSGVFSSEEVDTKETFFGKKVYRKTFKTNASLLHNAPLEIAIGLEGIAEKLWIDTQNSFLRASGNNPTLTIPTNGYMNEPNTYVYVWANSSAVRLISNSGWNNNWEKVITVKYTKL